MALPKTMRALVKVARGRDRIEMRQLPLPEIKGKTVLIRVKAAGICGSDIKILHDDHPYFPPVVLGHEFSGEIAGVGKDVKNWAVGERVVSEAHGYVCESCRFCLSGERHVCPSKRSLGWGIDGGFAEYVAVPAWLLHRIPDNLSYEEAALAEPASVAVHGILERAKVEPEDFVVILGCGPIGLLGLQMARAEGASRVAVTGTERSEKLRLKMAMELGADYIVNIRQIDPVKLVMEETEGIGADLVVDLTGSPSAITQGLEMVRTHGRFLAIGITKDREVSIRWKDLIFRAPEVIFHFSSRCSSWERALSLMAGNKVKIRPLITKALDLGDWREGMGLIESGNAIKVLLKP